MQPTEAQPCSLPLKGFGSQQTALPNHSTALLWGLQCPQPRAHAATARSVLRAPASSHMTRQGSKVSSCDGTHCSQQAVPCTVPGLPRNTADGQQQQHSCPAVGWTCPCCWTHEETNIREVRSAMGWQGHNSNSGPCDPSAWFRPSLHPLSVALNCGRDAGFSCRLVPSRALGQDPRPYNDNLHALRQVHRHLCASPSLSMKGSLIHFMGHLDNQMGSSIKVLFICHFFYKSLSH